MNEEEIENPPLWEIVAVAIFALLAALGGFSFILICAGYVWEKAA
jgi:hypothetical protein